MSDEQRIDSCTQDKVWRVGRAAVLRMVLASGRTLRATAEHRVFGANGWMTGRRVSVGDRVALARECPSQKAAQHGPSALILLGHLIGDGSYLTHQPLRYTTGSEENSDVVAAAATDEFGVHGVSARRSRKLASTGVLRQRQPLASAGSIVGSRAGGFQSAFAREARAEGVRVAERAGRRCSSTLMGDGRLIHARSAARRAEGLLRDRAARAGTGRGSAAVATSASLRALGPCVTARQRPCSRSTSRAGATALFLERVGAFGPRVPPADALARVSSIENAIPNVDTLPSNCSTMCGYRCALAAFRSGAWRYCVVRLMVGPAISSLRRRGHVVASYARNAGGRRPYGDGPIGRCSGIASWRSSPPAKRKFSI